MTTPRAVLCLHLLASAACTDPAPSATTTATATVAPSAPDELAGLPPSEVADKIVTWLSEGKYAQVRARFDAAMQKALPSDRTVEALWVSIQAKPGRFKKRLATAAKEEGGYTVVLVTCEFESMPMDLRLVFDKERRLAGIQLRPSLSGSAFGDRPQNPRPPFPYETREVLYDNPTDHSKLGGSLTLPAGKGPLPAVLLITGSGAQDRDETIFGHKPFWVIADRLSRDGVAVLRVDDRGVGKTTGDAASATLETHATDVESGLAFLAAQKEIDPQRIGLVGHSEGGIIAALVASRGNKSVAFVVSLAGTGVSGGELNPLQVEAIHRAMKVLPEEGITALVAAQRKIMQALASDADEATLKAAMSEAIVVAKKYLPKEEADKLDLDKAIADGLPELKSPWFRSFVKLDPRRCWSKVKVPVLAMNGDKDTQVPAEVNLREIQAALAKAGNKDVTAEKLAGLNHLFQTAKTGLLDEYSKIEETFNPKALDLLAGWIKKRAKLP